MFKFKNIIYIFILSTAIFIPHSALAVKTEFDDVSGLTEYVSNILAWLLPILGGIAVLTFIYAGYVYITSQGNPDRISHAKDIIIGTITGIVLLFLIQIILTQIGVQ